MVQGQETTTSKFVKIESFSLPLHPSFLVLFLLKDKAITFVPGQCAAMTREGRGTQEGEPCRGPVLL